jgi:hypothetical protein
VVEEEFTTFSKHFLAKPSNLSKNFFVIKILIFFKIFAKVSSKYQMVTKGFVISIFVPISKTELTVLLEKFFNEIGPKYRVISISDD